MNRSWYVWFGVWGLFIAFVVLPAGAQDTTATPPSPSYSDEWSESSPFFELRNDMEIDTPEEPEAPTVGKVEVDGETISVPGSPSSGTTPPDTEPKKATAEDTPNDRRKETSNQSTPSNGENTETDVTASTSGKDTPTSTGEPTSDPTGPPKVTSSGTDDSTGNQRTEPDPGQAGEQSRPDPMDRREEITVRSMLMSLAPDSAEPLTVTPGPELSTPGDTAVTAGTMIVDRSVVPATQKPREGFPFWWRFYWWIYGGFAGTVMIGMFFWLRKPRVEVIESHYSMADDGLTGTVGTDFGPSGRTSNKPSPGQRSVQPSGSRQVSREKPVLDELTPLLQELQDAGFNGNYEKLLRLYYEEGLTEDEIIERTARGRGEVGLVLDYVERLRKG